MQGIVVMQRLEESSVLEEFTAKCRNSDRYGYLHKQAKPWFWKNRTDAWPVKKKRLFPGEV